MITPVFASLSPRSVSRQPRQAAEPAAPVAQPNGNPVERHGEAIPGILNDIQQIMGQRRAQNQNAVRFGMDAQPPQQPDDALMVEDEEEEEPVTPPHQGIPLVVPNAPWVNHVAPPHHQQEGDEDHIEPLILDFNPGGHQNQQAIVPPTPANPFAQARANIKSPEKPPHQNQEEEK